MTHLKHSVTTPINLGNSYWLREADCGPGTGVMFILLLFSLTRLYEFVRVHTVNQFWL